MTNTEIVDVESRPARRGGRPVGAYSSPLARWLRLEIQDLRQDWNCSDAFEVLLLQNNGIGSRSFSIGRKTAEEVQWFMPGDIRGRVVTFDYFRKTWWRTSIDGGGKLCTAIDSAVSVP